MRRLPKVVGADPGKDQAWSLFVDGRLRLVGLGDPTVECVGAVAWLEDQYYDSRGRAKPDDIIKLARRGGWLWRTLDRELGCEVRFIKPRLWKGRIDKEKHHRRIRAELTPNELDLINRLLPAVAAPSKQHNIWDAIGLGLYGLRRLVP